MEAQAYPADAVFSAARDPCLPEWEHRAAFQRLILHKGLWPGHGDSTLYEIASAAAEATARVRCSRLCLSPDAVDPEGICQDALTLLYLKLHAIDSADCIPGWIRGTIRNLVVRRITKDWHFLTAKEISEATLAPRQFAGEGDRAHSERVARFSTAILGAINSLSVPLRCVAYLHLIEGKSHSDIARELGLMAPTIRQRWRRARNILQQKLAGLELPGSDEETVT